MELGQIGVWLRFDQLDPHLAALIERLGYSTIWVGGSPDADLVTVERLVHATEHIPIATGVVNIWKDPAKALAASFHRIDADAPGRVLLGVGPGHRETAEAYESPLNALEDYLDVLDAEGIPRERRILAALGPRALALSAARAAGAHPYLTTPAHTARARHLLGPDAVLAPEQHVLDNGDLITARKSLELYLGLENYRASWRRLGFTDDDFADGGSDALVEALIAFGRSVPDRVQAHLAGGANHVAIRPLSQDVRGELASLARALDLRPARH